MNEKFMELHSVSRGIEKESKKFSVPK
jgi:hypothetical protein